MADNKNDKPSAHDSSMNDSGELLRELFGEELDAPTLDGKGKPAAKKDNMKSAVKEPKSPSQGKGAGRKKAGPQIATEKKKIVKSYPVSQVRADKSKKAASKRGTLLKKEVEEKTAPQVKDDTREEIRPEEVVEITETKGAERGFGGKLGQNSDKLKIAVLSVILVAAVGFIINSLGIVDFAGLLGFSEPTKKERIKPRIAKKTPTKTGQKKIRVAIKPPQKRTSRQVADKATFPKRMLIVKKPPQASPWKARPQTVKKSPKPTTTAKKSVIAQKPHEPATPTKKPLVVQGPPEPTAPKQRPAVVMKPSQPTISTQKPVVDKKPYKAIASQPRPVVAKKPPAVATPKPLPVVKEPARPAGQRWKKPTLGKEELFPEEGSYPYSVCLASYKTRKKAEKAISDYQRKGLSPYWVKVALGDKGVWFRVFLGYFQKRGRANEFMEKKKIKGAESRHTRYANLIGTYKSQEKLNGKRLAILELGYCPYVINGVHGESLLYTGAFYQRRRAE